MPSNLISDLSSKTLMKHSKTTWKNRFSNFMSRSSFIQDSFYQNKLKGVSKILSDFCFKVPANNKTKSFKIIFVTQSTFCPISLNGIDDSLWKIVERWSRVVEVFIVVRNSVCLIWPFVVASCTQLVVQTASVDIPRYLEREPRCAYWCPYLRLDSIPQIAGRWAACSWISY